MESFKKEYLSKFNLDIDNLRINALDKYHNIGFILDMKFKNNIFLLDSIYKKKNSLIVIIIRQDLFFNYRQESLKNAIDILYNNDEIIRDMIKQIQQ